MKYEKKIKCKQHDFFHNDCVNCWYAWGFDRGEQQGREVR